MAVAGLSLLFESPEESLDLAGLLGLDLGAMAVGVVGWRGRGGRRWV